MSDDILLGVASIVTILGLFYGTTTLSKYLANKCIDKLDEAENMRLKKTKKLKVRS